jgi:hypothetical protein
MTEKVNLNSAWFRDLSNRVDEKQRRQEMLQNASPVLDLLAKIILEEVKAVEKTSLDDYDIPNWALKEADRHGQVRFARKMLEILKRTPV